MTHCCEHNYIEELKTDHKKILEKVDELEDAVNVSLIDKNKVKEFLHFTEIFAEPHHQKEEKVLFPALEKKGMPKEGGPIGVMLFDHETKRGHIRELQKALDENKENEIKEQSLAIISLLREHINKEEGILYPCAEDILTEDELKNLGPQCQKIKESYEIRS